jgi:hypothetical protein
MPSAQEPLASSDHRRGIGGSCATVADIKVDVALPRDIEDMPVLAPQGLAVWHQRRGADGTAQSRQSRDKRLSGERTGRVHLTRLA